MSGGFLRVCNDYDTALALVESFGKCINMSIAALLPAAL
jgi:hypothetical protein